MKKNVWLLFIILTFVGCTTTQKATTVGTVGGATIGGIIGHQSGHGGEGAAIGGAVGALGGYIVGEKMKKKFCCPATCCISVGRLPEPMITYARKHSLY